MASVNLSYDVGVAFEAITEALIDDMMDDFRKNRLDDGSHATMWQAEQLASLDKYKRRHRPQFLKQSQEINEKIEETIKELHSAGGLNEERRILDAIRKGFKAYTSTPQPGISAGFYKINDRKLEALIKAALQDMERAEISVLRQTEDEYRKIIFNAQTYVNTGSGTYEQAVDMAARDFLSQGISSIIYKNGSRHTIEEYSRMALKTAGKRAYLQGEGTMRQNWGICTVIVNKRGNPCPRCLPHCGKIYIDDVWSGGPKSGISPATGKQYPLISTAIEGGLFHPNCRDSHTTYFEGISTPPDSEPHTKEEIEEINARYQKEQARNHANSQILKYRRLEKNSLDPENKKRYRAMKDKWTQKLKELK